MIDILVSIFASPLVEVVIFILVGVLTLVYLFRILGYVIGLLETIFSAKPPTDTTEPSANPPGKRVWVAKNLKRFRRYLKKNRIYFVISAFCALGIFVLRQAPNVNAERSAYYFIILIGATSATFISVWRGRQFEWQIQNSRFEKAVDMATDPASKARRGSGFLILKQMFFTSRGRFDDLMEENIDVLTHLIRQNFQMKKKRRDSAEKLYEKNRVTYSFEDKDADRLFVGAQKPLIDKVALELCSTIADKERRKQGHKKGKKRKGEITPSVFNYKANDGVYSFFIFPGIDLKGLKIFLLHDNGQILLPEKKQRPNFKGCLIMRAEMRGAIVDHVDFSESNLLKINYMGEESSNISCIGTRFDFVNLIDCNFRGADFKDASFNGTNISGSDFSQTNLTPKQFKTAYWIRPNDPQLLRQAKPKFPGNFPRGFADTLPDRDPE